MKTKQTNEKFEWTNECQREFLDFVDELSEPNILGHPDFDPKSEPFILSCDTSKLGVGSILNQFQRIKNGNDNLTRIKLVIGQFGHGCDPYALVKSDKVDICLSEMY